MATDLQSSYHIPCQRKMRNPLIKRFIGCKKEIEQVYYNGRILLKVYNGTFPFL